MFSERGGETGRELDQLFRLLADRHRRYTLYYLDAAESDVVTLDEIARYIAEQTHTDAGDRERSNEITHERLRTRLHHNHLPKLAETSLIEYDARSQTVRDWGEPSPMKWAQYNQNELPLLRSLFCTSATERRV